MKLRMTAIERHIAGSRRDAVLDAETTVNMQQQVDQQLFGTDDPPGGVGLPQRNAAEASQRAGDLVNMRPGLPLGREMHLMGSHVLPAQAVRRAAETTTEPGDGTR